MSDEPDREEDTDREDGTRSEEHPVEAADGEAVSKDTVDPVDAEGSSEAQESVDAMESSDAVDSGDAGDPGDASEPVAGYEWTPAWLLALRLDRDRRHVALVAAVIVGVSAAWLHWIGLVLAGALVGLVSESVPKAVAGGLVVGVLVLVVHVGASPVMGAGEFVGLAPAAYVTIGAALVAPLWGSLVRAVV